MIETLDDPVHCYFENAAQAANMDEETKAQFDVFDKRIAAVDKRFDDVKWFIGGTSAFFAIVVSLYTYLATSNVQSQKADIKDFLSQSSETLKTTVSSQQRQLDGMQESLSKELDLGSSNLRESKTDLKDHLTEQTADLARFEQQVRSDLGDKTGPPVLEILGPNNQSIDGQELVGRLENFPFPNSQAVLHFDTFLRNSGKANSGPLNVKFYARKPLQLADPSEDEKEFDSSVAIQEITPNDIPGGGYDAIYTWNLHLAGKAPPPGKYPMKVKFYYGGSRVVEAQFTVAVGR